MITKIYELSVYINNKSLPILNTEIDIIVDWDVNIVKNNEDASLKYTFRCVYGSFLVHDNKELYKKTTKYQFKTDDTWKVNHIPYSSDNLSPTSAVLNFDDKTIKIKF